MTHHRYTEAELALPDHGAWVRRGNTRVWETSDETWSRNDGDRASTRRSHSRAQCGFQSTDPARFGTIDTCDKHPETGTK